LIIERIQVEEGFLDGLDLTLRDGLNVLIGPRGTGKTSIIELIRFCLGVRGYTEKSDAKAREHALSILSSGQVTVTLKVDGERILVTRTASEDDPRRSSEYQAPLIFSQNEIEAVGLHSSGRLKIIDGFRSARTTRDARIAPLLSQIRSLTAEAKSLSDEVDSVNEQLTTLADIPEQLKQAEREQQTQLKTATASAPKQKELQSLSEQGAAVAVRSTVFDRALATAGDLKARIEALLGAQFALDQWPAAAGPGDQLNPIRTLIDGARKQVEQALTLLREAIGSIQQLQTANQQQRLELEQRARQLRRSLEELKAGAGAAAKRVAELGEKAGQLSALKTLLAERKDRLEMVRQQRNALLDQLDHVRKERFDERTTIALRLNTELGPRINVAVERAGTYQEYIDAIGAALRGSGLHYNTLAPVMAQGMSPRELVEAVESRNVQALCDLVSLTPDRASRVISEIAARGAEQILTSAIEDSVTMSLLDGTDYKTTENLSTGQRCTVILPILLGHHGQTLVVDQPEDHLDNAFIVETLIEAMKKRGQGGQLLFSTHNANIPVLGEAQNVVLLGSDGRRGFVRHVGLLDDPKSVEAITTVMEGGREAFLRRARFYESRLG
jgi:ABC-type taurine transport system ATPase subunit